MTANPSQFKKIVVPIDFSDCSRHALTRAIEWAKAFGASVEVLYVWEPPHYLMPDTTVFIPGHPDQTMIDYAQAEAKKSMDDFLEKHGSAKDLPLTVQMLSGPPAETILNYVQNNAIDLIVMGTHGRTGLQRFLIGSVTEKIVRRASCPVLTLHS